MQMNAAYSSLYQGISKVCGYAVIYSKRLKKVVIARALARSNLYRGGLPRYRSQ